MTLDELVSRVGGFHGLNHADKIRLFAWYVHTHGGKDVFAAPDIKACFDSLHVAGPSNISSFLASMVVKKPPDLLQTRAGFRLERKLRDKYDAEIGQRPTIVALNAMFAALLTSLPDLKERDYLDEALLCFRAGAHRGAIVMAWNMAYDHFFRWVLAKHLSAFNAQLPKSFPKADIHVITKVDDFGDLKESQVLQVARSAGLISPSLHKVMKEKLDRRNVAAHPSGVSISPLTAEEFIVDLVQNVVLKLGQADRGSPDTRE